MNWKSTLTILCLFGFLKEFRPSGPIPYIQLKNVIFDQVKQELLLPRIFFNFASLILVFSLTDLLRYKPIIVLCGITGMLLTFPLIIGTTIPTAQALFFTSTLFMATEVAYYTYIYAKLDKKLYEKATSFTRATILIGQFGAATLGWRLIQLLDYSQLCYLTFTAMVLATICALFLPSVDHSIHFNRGDGNTESNKSSANDIRLELKYQPEPSFSTKLKRTYGYLWKDFLQAFSNFEVFKWSLWWALATCGYAEIQCLWEALIRTDDVDYKGAIGTVYFANVVAAVFCVGRIKINWTQYGDATLASCTLLQGLLLVLNVNTPHKSVIYGCYIAFGIIYHTLMTVASFEVAKKIPEDSYALIFGFNTFVASAVQSLFVFSIMSNIFFETTIRDQFIIYSFFFFGVGAIFTIFASKSFKRRRNRTS